MVISSNTSYSLPLIRRLEKQIVDLVSEGRDLLKERKYDDMIDCLSQASNLAKDTECIDYVTRYLDIAADKLSGILKYSEAKICLEMAYDLSKKQYFHVKVLFVQADMLAHRAKYSEACTVATNAFKISNSPIDLIKMMVFQGLDQLNNSNYKEAAATFNSLYLIASDTARSIPLGMQKKSWWRTANQFKEQAVIVKLRHFIDTMNTKDALEKCQKIILREKGKRCSNNALKNLLLIEVEAKISRGKYCKAVEILEELSTLTKSSHYTNRADKLKKLLQEEALTKDIEIKKDVQVDQGITQNVFAKFFSTFSITKIPCRSKFNKEKECQGEITDNQCDKFDNNDNTSKKLKKDSFHLKPIRSIKICSVAQAKQKVEINVLEELKNIEVKEVIKTSSDLYTADTFYNHIEEVLKAGDTDYKIIESDDVRPY